jgi:hypothetical protein
MKFPYIVLMVLAASVAVAQTPAPRPDVPLLSTGGIYPVRCMSPDDADMKEICFVRTDLPDVVELGCAPAGFTRPDCEVEEPVDGLPSCIASLDLSIEATPDDDAEIRCYAVDISGLVSDYSENAGTVDFTRPGRPFVQ